MGCDGFFCPGLNHVANGYSEPIFVFIDADRVLVTSKSVEVKNKKKSASYEDQSTIVHIANSIGYTKVMPKSFILFKPGHENRKYVSIFTLSGIFVSEAYPIGCNDSVVVDNQASVSMTKMGTVWEKRTGN